MPPINLKPKDYSRVFETFGVGFSRNGSTQVRADACPWCGKGKFYLDPVEGLYHCKHCEERGNVTKYLTWQHRQYLDATTSEDYSRLRAQRGGFIAPQTLRLHELAYVPWARYWIIPFFNAQGNIFTMQLYFPDGREPSKMNLPGLPTGLYGFDKLVAAPKDKPVLLCEGPFDAIALDYGIGAEHRPRYVIVATPGPFRADWAPYFKDRKVRALFDNDKGGQAHRDRAEKLLGRSGAARELLALKWPEDLPDGYDVHDLVRDLDGKKVLSWLNENCYEVVRESKLAWTHGWERHSTAPGLIKWVWPDHLRTRTYASFSGRGGSFKSTIARLLIAYYTRGKPMPFCEKVGLPAGHVIYITAEDDEDTAWEQLEQADADLSRVTVLPGTLKDGSGMNLLQHLDELREVIRKYAVRFVVVDGQNSVVGAPCIATDMLARHHVTNPLHQFAQREDICLLGIRNEDRYGRPLGPQSMGDLGRCIMHTEELKRYKGDRYFMLHFDKVSDVSADLYPPIPFSIEGLPGATRRILWGKARPRQKGDEGDEGDEGAQDEAATGDVSGRASADVSRNGYR
jgi:hypothetical protein